MDGCACVDPEDRLGVEWGRDRTAHVPVWLLQTGPPSAFRSARACLSVAMGAVSLEACLRRSFSGKM
eukprot:1833949-Pleurochrysis_carterae.AAC.1